MKLMDLQCITHCTDEDYQLITIHGADNTLIHIKPSKTLQKWLMKQKNKIKSIKTRVNWVQQALLLPNGMQHRTSNLITNETWKMTRWMMIHNDDRRDDMVEREDMQERWIMNDGKRDMK